MKRRSEGGWTAVVLCGTALCLSVRERLWDKTRVGPERQTQELTELLRKPTLESLLWSVFIRLSPWVVSENTLRAWLILVFIDFFKLLTPGNISQTGIVLTILSSFFSAFANKQHAVFLLWNVKLPAVKAVKGSRLSSELLLSDFHGFPLWALWFHTSLSVRCVQR